MSNDLAKRPSFGNANYDDGFDSPPSSDRSTRTSFLRWTEQLHWVDRDGIPPPSPLLVLGLAESVRRWRTVKGETGKEFKQPEDIFDKPLPDPRLLNESAPPEERERQLDGSVSAGWKHEYFVFLVDLVTGTKYTWSNSTAGASIAWEQLKEAVVTMRALRGSKCYPQVELTERPMPSRFRPSGMGMRPHFQILPEWKTPGPSSLPPAPQLEKPAAAAPPAPATNAPAAAREPRPHPIPAPVTKAPSAKRPVTVSAYTKAVMTGMADVKPITTEELLNDSLDDMAWDSDPPQK
jgi:hypothetical protein